MYYLKQLAAQAGHELDLTLIGKDAWMAASRQAHLGNYQPFTACIADAITPPDT